MRAFILIWSFFLMAQTLLPCADLVSGDEHATEVAEHGDHSDDHGCNDDHCSPFCLCQCCHQHFRVESAFEFHIVAQVAQPLTSLEPRTQEVRVRLLRPPRIG